MLKQKRYINLLLSIDALSSTISLYTGGSWNYDPNQGFERIDTESVLDVWNQTLLSGDRDSDLKLIELQSKRLSKPIQSALFKSLYPSIHQVLFAEVYGRPEWILDTIDLGKFTRKDMELRIGLLKIASYL